MTLPIGFVLDASNLWRLLPGPPLVVLDRITAALRARFPTHGCILFADRSLPGEAPAAEQADFARRRADGSLRLPPPGEPADPHLLALARDLRAVVVSRDRFREHRSARLDVPVLTPAFSADGALATSHALIHASDRRLLRVDVADWLRQPRP